MLSIKHQSHSVLRFITLLFRSMLDTESLNFRASARRCGIALCFVVLFTGCKRSTNDRPVGRVLTIEVPLGLPAVPIPANNPPTAESIDLGRRLFYDTALSRDHSMSCASCHNPRLGFTDGLQVAHGVGGSRGTRNAPTLINSAYLPLQFWDGRSASLEDQAANPIANPLEMNQSHQISLAKLAENPTYRSLFFKAFGSRDINLNRVEKALASFERTILSGNSPFDRYQFSKDKGALTSSQVRGLQIFLDPNKGNCGACHTVNRTDALFTDGKFHNTGEGAGDEGEFADVGRFGETKTSADMGAFKTPTLRNVANTAPYMHDGSLKTLKDVVDFYAGGGNSNTYLDKQIRVLQLTGQDRADLVEFLKSLSGEMPRNVGDPGNAVNRSSQ